MIHDGSQVRLGLVGVGRWGRNYVRTLSNMPEAQLVAVASSNPATANLVASCCLVYHDWRKMFDEADIEGVIVATPPASHAEITAAALERGLAVMVEKPLTLDAPSARALLEIARLSRRPVLVDHTHLFSPAWRALKAEVSHLGPIQTIEGICGNLGPYRADTDVLWDWGSHDVAMVIDLLKSLPSSVRATHLERKTMGCGIGEKVSLDLRFDTASAHFFLSNMIPKTRKFKVICVGGELIYDDVASHKLTLNHVPIKISPTMPLEQAVKDFATAIRFPTDFEEQLKLGIAVVETLSSASATLSADRVPGIGVTAQSPFD